MCGQQPLCKSLSKQLLLLGRVGNHLGAGDAHRARAAALTGLCTAPCIVLVTAVLLVEPHCQALLLRAFAGAHASPDLQARLKGLLRILAVMQAFDCVQSQMQGVVQVQFPCVTFGMQSIKLQSA